LYTLLPAEEYFAIYFFKGNALLKGVHLERRVCGVLQILVSAVTYCN